jgi:hypothetical protein
MNARRAQVYNALFDGELNRITEDRAIAAADLAVEVSKYEKVYLCGDGVQVALDGGVDAIPAPERLRHQSGYSVAQCALKNISRASAQRIPSSPPFIFACLRQSAQDLKKFPAPLSRMKGY